MDYLLDDWRESIEKISFEDKLELISKKYSERLEGFSREGIDNVLEFLKNRQEHGGHHVDDIVLSDEGKEIMELMEEYGQSIKGLFVSNGGLLTHVTSVPPEKLNDRKLAKSMNRANHYQTEVVDAVFASSTPVSDGKNLYIARNNSGMVMIDSSTCVYGNNSINVVEGDDGKKRAELLRPNYIYYMKPETFTPVCTIRIDRETHRPKFDFSEEWISEDEMSLDNPDHIVNVEEVRDVTDLLKNFTILCDTQNKGIGMDARGKASYKEALKYLSDKIRDGSLRCINAEVGINDERFWDEALR